MVSFFFAIYSAEYKRRAEKFESLSFKGKDFVDLFEKARKLANGTDVSIDPESWYGNEKQNIKSSEGEYKITDKKEGSEVLHRLASGVLVETAAVTQQAFDGSLDRYNQRTQRGDAVNNGDDVQEDDMEEMRWRDRISDMENKLDSMEGMMAMMESSLANHRQDMSSRDENDTSGEFYV